MEKKVTTEALWARLLNAPSARDYIENAGTELDPPAFAKFISSLCRERGEVAEHIINRAGIERSFGHQLFRGARNPSRDTVLQLAFGFGADTELAQALLRRAGHSQLYPRIRRDAAVVYCLEHGASLIETQQLLAELALPLLGGGTK